MKTLPEEREIGIGGQTGALTDLMKDLLIAELMQPSTRLWLFFAWISDVEIVQNGARQFAALAPEWPPGPVRLITVLDSLLERGAQIRILMREHPHNRRFVNALEPLLMRHGPALAAAFAPDFHDKCILGDGYKLSGSMNLTFNGLTKNEERVILTRNPEKIAITRLSLDAIWQRHAG